MALVLRTITAGGPIYAADGSVVADTLINFIIVDPVTFKQTDVWDAVEDPSLLVGVGGSVTTDAGGIFPDIGLWPNSRGNKTTLYLCTINHPDFTPFLASLPEGDLSPLTFVEFAMGSIPLTPAELTAFQLHIENTLIHVPPPVTENDFLLTNGAGAWWSRTVAQVQAILGLGSAAYTNSGLYVAASEKGAANGVPTLDANSLIPLSQIPPTAIERIILVADEVSRYLLTTADVQNGDTVKDVDTGLFWAVIDDTNLGNPTGYLEYSVGLAASAPWGGITGKPSSVKQQIIDLGDAAANPQECDYSLATQYRILCTANPFNLTLSNFPTAANSGEFLLELENAGLATITWLTTVNWVMPDGTTTIDIATYLLANGGRTALQSLGKDFFIFWVDYQGLLHGKLM